MAEEASEQPVTIEVSAHGNRRALEALYLDMRELAKQNGLEIEFQLSKSKPAEPSG